MSLERCATLEDDLNQTKDEVKLGYVRLAFILLYKCLFIYDIYEQLYALPR